MKKITFFTAALITSTFFSLPTYGQYKKGQKLVNFAISVNYENSNNIRPYSLTENKYLAKQERDWYSFDYFSIGSAYLKTDRFKINKSIGMYYSGQKNNTISRDTFGQIHVRNLNGTNQFFVFYGVSYTWLFPVKPKWGVSITESNQISIGIFKNITLTDSADFVFSKFNYSKILTDISVHLGVGLYYWIKPRIVLNTGITLLNVNYELGYTQLNSTNYNQEQPSKSYFSQSINIDSKFNNTNNLANIYVGIQFLLK